LQRVRPVFYLGAHLRHVFADFLCHVSSVFHRPGLCCRPAVVWIAITACATVDLRPPAAQDAFLIISQFYSPANSLGGKWNCRSLPSASVGMTKCGVAFPSGIWCLGWEAPKDLRPDLGRDFDTHGACRALDALHCGLDGNSVQVGHLLLGNLQHLFLGYRAYLVLIRGA
jgi:hypothetical protein